MTKKNIIFRFDFKRKKNLSYGHFFRANKIISYLGNTFNIFYLIKTKIIDNQYNYLKNKNLKQVGSKLLLNGKQFQRKIDYLIVDLPYKDIEINLFKSQVGKIIVIEDHFKNYNLANFYFTNLKLKKKQLNKINLNKNCIFHGDEYLINDQKSIKNRPNRKIKKIFVNFGGSDPLNLTTRFLNVVNCDIFSKYIFYLVLGPGCRKFRTKNIKKNINIFQNLSKKKLDLLRRKSDIAVVSGGNILIENIFLGLPSFAFASSKYENNIINQLMRNNLVLKFKSFESNRFINAIELFNYKTRLNIFMRSKKMVKNNKFLKKLTSILNL